LCEQRTTDAAVSARRLPTFVAALFFRLRDSYSWQHWRPVYAVKPDIRPESRFCLPHLHSTPPLGGFPSEYRHPVWYRKTRFWWGYRTVKNLWRYVYSFWHDPRTWQTDRHTDTAWRHRPRLCIALRGKKRKEQEWVEGAQCQQWNWIEGTSSRDMGSIGKSTDDQF